MDGEGEGGAASPEQPSCLFDASGDRMALAHVKRRLSISTLFLAGTKNPHMRRLLQAP